MSDLYNVSVMLPTRGRTISLLTSLQSLIDLADNVDKVEFFLGFDKDDVETQQYFIKNIQPRLDQQNIHYSALTFDPMGYTQLHAYYNKMASRSTAEWLVIWNDDAVMQTQGWDSCIMKYSGQFRVLSVETHNHHPYSIFPILPRKWFELLGYISKHQLNDAWVSQIAFMLDIMVRIPVTVLHDRADLTGNNKDSTFGQRVIFEGNDKDPRDFNHISARTARQTDSEKLSQYLASVGDDITWWNNVKLGKQDPWEKMLSEENDPNHQVRKWK
jgi:hypothetical protein